jgi:hypothetical protein
MSTLKALGWLSVAIVAVATFANTVIWTLSPEPGYSWVAGEALVVAIIAGAILTAAVAVWALRRV